MYSTRYYSDLLAFSPILEGYKAIVVVRHPLDRILAATNHYKSNTKDDWLFNSAIYEQQPSSGKSASGLTFQKFITSLSDKDALLYGIYVSSLYFNKEMIDLDNIRKLMGEGFDFIKLEDFYNNTEQALVKVEKDLSLEPYTVAGCMPSLMNERDNLKL